jgi:hypothetical protein
MPTLDDAITVIRTGNAERGREILEEILETDENNEEVWLWLSSVVDTDEDREICLENVLAINPDNVVAQRGLEALRQGTFNVHNIMEEALDEFEEFPEEEGDDDFSGGTFLDEFTMAGEDDEELEFPSTMKSGKKGGGLNIRIILIVVLVLCVVLALGGAAAYNVLLGGDGGPTDVPSQETPVDEGQPEAEATDTPAPTDTPTPTNTPFQLPTKEPTPLPTPTATIVVSPTPP